MIEYNSDGIISGTIKNDIIINELKLENLSVEEKVELLKEAQKEYTDICTKLDSKTGRPLFPEVVLDPVCDSLQQIRNSFDVHTYFFEVMGDFRPNQFLTKYKDSPNLFKSVGEYFIKLGEYTEELKINEGRLLDLVRLQKDIKENLGIQ